MGRRRNKGETRSAGAGRPCKHPASAIEYQVGAGTPRARCTRCGQELIVDLAGRPRDPARYTIRKG